MSRLTAWVILIVALAFAYSLALTRYDHLTDRYRSTDSGGLVRVEVQCPSPVSVLFFDAEPELERDHGACELSARAHLIEAVLVLLVGLLLAWKPVTRKRPEPIRPLSERLRL